MSHTDPKTAMRPRVAEDADGGLRRERVRNYRIKFRDGYRCQHEGCSTDRGLLVVKVAKGNEDDAYSTRCEPHARRQQVVRGQWIDQRDAPEAKP